MRTQPLLIATTGLALLTPMPAAAQGYRLRFDARAQAISYRALEPDSVPIGEVSPGPNGGPQTADGFAVRCGGSYCYFFRPGADLRAIPVTTSASLVLWGLGVPGLSVHAATRVVAQAGDAGSWPGTDPSVQLLEGYAQYERDWLTGRGGRLLVTSRLEPIGFDGVWARARWASARLDFAAYGGWGLGQATVVPVANPALNPLDEWRPRDRQLVAGAEVAWAPGPADVRAEYRREVDPETDYFVSERASLSVATHLWHALRATGGLDYNLAEGHLGSADLSATYMGPFWSATVGGRRYHPYFSLWTLWGAFSPVPYHALHGSAQVHLGDRVRLSARAERYWYEDTETSTALVRVEDRGWRASLGATGAISTRVTVDAGYFAEFGPGAAARGADLEVRFEPVGHLALTAYGGALERPLELRFYEANTRWIGGRVEWRASDEWRFWGDGAWVDDSRDRPDPAANSVTQVRLRAGATVILGSGADRRALPPARRRDP